MYRTLDLEPHLKYQFHKLINNQPMAYGVIVKFAALKLPEIT